MPELPDLQVFSTNLTKKLQGKTITSVKVPAGKKLNVSLTALKKAIVASKIKRVIRSGKELHIELSSGDSIGMHLMLHGNLYFFEGKNDHKHVILELTFDDDTGLVLTDWQSAATVTLNPEERDAPDALDKKVTYPFLKEALQTKAIIKNVLLNQKIIRGIGNAYADEILWEAGISPFSISNMIPDTAVKALARAIKKVLTQAEKQIRKSHPDIITGEVRDFLLIHNSKKKTGPGGAVIETKTAGGRKTYFTNEQELYK